MVWIWMLFACTTSSRPQVEMKKSPSVLIVTLDTTRADYLSPYGSMIETPIYERLAMEGTVFERAYSPCPLTIPAHSTIMTGMSPIKHGVRDNGEFLLGDEHVTLAERFHDAGYFTSAFTSAFPTQSHWGFGQGFDLYHDPLTSSAATRDWRDERRAGDVVDDFIRLMNKQSGPVFSWVHLFDAHWPYDPPEPFASQYSDDLYGGEIAYAASQVERLIDWWQERYPQSIVVITADHGEGLGEGGEQTHGFLLHDGTIRVPMIVSGIGVPEGQRIDYPVGLIDIAPTVLELAELPLHVGIEGQNLFQERADTPVYSESLTAQRKLGLYPLHAHSKQAGRFVDGLYDSFYPVKADVVSTESEPSDVLIEEIAKVEAYVSLAETVDATIAPMDAETLQHLEALGYMGGVMEGTTQEIDPRDVIDVIPLTWQVRTLLAQRNIQRAEILYEKLANKMGDSLGVLEIQASILQNKGDIYPAIDIYTEVFHQSKNSTIALQIANAYASVADWELAYDWFREAHELYPTHARTMYGMVTALVKLNRLAEAQEYTEQFLAIHPDLDELALLRGEFLLAEFRLEEALIESQRVLDRAPWSPSSHSLHARVLWELGESDQAIDFLHDALRMHPVDGMYRIQLATWLMELHRFAEAFRLIKPMTRLNPDNGVIWELYQEARRGLEEQLGHALPE